MGVFPSFLIPLFSLSAPHLVSSSLQEIISLWGSTGSRCGCGCESVTLTSHCLPSTWIPSSQKRGPTPKLSLSFCLGLLEAETISTWGNLKRLFTPSSHFREAERTTGERYDRTSFPLTVFHWISEKKLPVHSSDTGQAPGSRPFLPSACLSPPPQASSQSSQVLSGMWARKVLPLMKLTSQQVRKEIIIGERPKNTCKENIQARENHQNGTSNFCSVCLLLPVF